MQVLWMPYVRFTRRQFREQNVEIGSVTLWPHRDSTWQHLGIARPAWFDIYREFPGHGKEQIGQPCRGTVAVGTQPEWLAQNYKRLVAVLYFIGDVACFQGDPQTGRPGECFYARTFPLNVQSHELVQLWTKHGGLIEDDKSLKVTPPIAVRGHLDPYFLDTQRVEHAALVELLFRNSEHRLITACLHYFLAQMGDPMIVSFEQDYANYCASLEAAFDIRQGDAGDDGEEPAQGEDELDQDDLKAGAGHTDSYAVPGFVLARRHLGIVDNWADQGNVATR